MRKQIEGTKSNNKGFTLLEVLVAMVILTIICVPLLRSMATSAQTNAKAKIQSRCTIASENVMEQLRNMSVEDIYTTCSGLPNFSPTTPSGVEEDIHFDIVDNSVMNIDLPDGYTAKVDLNANVGADGFPAYPNANGLNMSDFSPISVRDCAIYTMPKDMDKDVYDWYADRSSDFGRSYTREDFRKDLTRDIIVTIMDTGMTYTDDEGNTKNAIKVRFEIKYRCSANMVDDANQNYVKTSVYLFDNSTTHQDFNGVYIFFYPRYTAANRGDSIRRDVIEVYNESNIKTDFYAVAMNNGNMENDADRDSYLMRGNKGLYLKIKEGSLTDGKAGVSLKTNLLKTSGTTSLRTPYSMGDTATDYGLGLEVEYGLNGGTTYRTFGDPDPTPDNICDMLSIADIDGKLLKNDTDVRIYKVSVSVVNNATGEEISKMEGSKLTTN